MTMKFRAGCDNCGYVGMYEAPKRSKLVPYNADPEKAAFAGQSYLINPDGRNQPAICDNCGLSLLEILYWDRTSAKDPMLEIRKITAQVADPDELA